jgi:TetR/AcrR family transcriptional regulator
MALVQPRNCPVRDRLLHAAMELFASRGYAATSIREIVEAAGVTKPVLYYHFQSKEGLFLALFDALQVTVEDKLSRSLALPGKARERIGRLFDAFFALFEEHRASVRFMNAAYWGPAEGVPAIDLSGLHLKFVTTLERMVAEGVAAGELGRARVADVAHTLLAVLSYSMDLALAHPEASPGRAGLHRALDLVFTGIASPSAFRRRSSP